MKHTASTVLYCPIKICQFKQTHIQYIHPAVFYLLQETEI